MNFLFSSLGKKIQIAFSGFLLCFFLLFHLFNNLTLIIGPDVFNPMVKFLESIKPIIRIMEFGLLGVLLMHIVNAIILTIENKKQKPSKYLVTPTETSSVNSRTMIISGTIILLFFIIHLRYLWYTYQVHAFGVDETYYDVILRNEFGYLGHTPTSVFYIVAILFIAMHIKHGFQSALKTFGILEQSTLRILYKIAVVFWAIIPALFILIILLIQFGYIQ
jgi:succinate dehydrogenase / fumarate reductase cytochrome b subunit